MKNVILSIVSFFGATLSASFSTPPIDSKPETVTTVVTNAQKYKMNSAIMEFNKNRAHDACLNVELKELSIAIDSLPSMSEK